MYVSYKSRQDIDHFYYLMQWILNVPISFTKFSHACNWVWLWKVPPLNLHFVVSARMFSLEMSWRCCYTWLQAALPLCNLRVLRHEALSHFCARRLRSSQFMFLANIKQSPNIGFRILFSSGPLIESLTLSRKLKLEMLFPPDTSTHLLLQQSEENNLKEKYFFCNLNEKA